jgi:hypothetical protein
MCTNGQIDRYFISGVLEVGKTVTERVIISTLSLSFFVADPFICTKCREKNWQTINGGTLSMFLVQSANN